MCFREAQKILLRVYDLCQRRRMGRRMTPHLSFSSNASGYHNWGLFILLVILLASFKITLLKEIVLPRCVSHHGKMREGLGNFLEFTNVELKQNEFNVFIQDLRFHRALSHYTGLGSSASLHRSLPCVVRSQLPLMGRPMRPQLDQ